MNSTLRNISLTLLFILSAFSQCHSQSMGCSDSIGSYYYNIHNIASSFSIQSGFATGVLNSNVVDNNNNLLIQLDTADKNKNGFTLGIAKLNPQNKLLYRRVYHQSVFDSIEYLLSFTNSNNDIILSGAAVDEQSGYGNAGAICTLDSSGNMKWQRKYRNPNPDPANFRIMQSCAGKNNDIVALSSDVNSVNPYRIALLDSTGNIKWAKSYDSSDSTFINIEYVFIVFNGSEIIMMGQLQYDSYNRRGFCISRINYTTGKLIESQSYKIISDQTYISPFWLNEYNHLNYNPISKKYMIDLFPEDRLRQGLMAITLNEDLSIDQAKMFSADPAIALGPTSVNADNTIGYCVSSFIDTSLLYAEINENLNLVSQKKIKLAGYPVSNYFGEPVFRKNGSVNIQVFSSSPSGLNNFLQLENSSAYGVNNNCLGYDTSFLSPADVTVLPLKIKLDMSSDLSLSVEDVPVLSSEDRDMPQQVYCKQVSICDTIKIKGLSQYCFPDSIANFTLYKNPQCLRKTEWHIDTTALKITASRNDTTLLVQFLKPYNGYIYAGFAGCELKDSLKINVLMPKQNFAINKDSIVCPGKNIVLQASEGFQTYQWQDGSSLSSYLVTKAGFYKVTAMDSCEKLFGDSITINAGDTSFVLPKSNSICLYDTLHLDIPSSINNITWQPFENVLRIQNQLLFFPATTTQYQLKGVSVNNCEVSSSIEIKIKDCPEYVYFPNTFTPNDDGINDVFKPLFEGKFDFYNLKIYNRWGQLIFQNANAAIGWNGTYKGIPQESDSYVYACTYKFRNSLQKNVKGYIILIK
jgi:gliding motility-associated-like protein